MHLTRLALTNFRNYAHLELDLTPGVLLIHGGNACGVAMALHGEEFPNLAWYASMESPYGEGSVNVELGGRETGVNPAYGSKTGELDLSKLAWSPDLTPGMRGRETPEAQWLRGSLFFDLDGDGRFSRDADFPANAFVADLGQGAKVWYSARLMREAGVHVLLSLRDDFLMRCAEHEEIEGTLVRLPSLGDAKSMVDAARHAIAVAVSLQRIGGVLLDLGAVKETVAIGIGIERIGHGEVLPGLRPAYCPAGAGMSMTVIS